MINKNELYVKMHDKAVGILKKDLDNKLFFQYFPDAHVAISLSMPIKDVIYEHKHCKAFFGGLLPQDKSRLHTFCEYYGARPVNTFNILKLLGQDCLGTITFSTTLDEVSSDKLDIEILDRKKYKKFIKKHLTESFYGNKSYKHIYPYCTNLIPCCSFDDKIALPVSGVATHFLQISDNKEHILEKYIYLQVAKSMSIPVPEVSIHRIDQFYYLILSRTDRILKPNYSVLKLHQESIAQSLGMRKSATIMQIQDFIRLCFQMCDKTTIPAINRNSLVKLIIFNYLQHRMKELNNYSVLYESAHFVRMGPFIDFCVETQDFEQAQVNLNWQQICEQNNYSYKAFIKMFEDMKEEIKEVALVVSHRLKEDGFL